MPDPKVTRVKKRSQLKSDMNAAQDWMRQLQDKGASNSIWGEYAEGSAREHLLKSAGGIGEKHIQLFGEHIDVVDAIHLFFGPNEPYCFQPLVDDLSARLNRVLSRVDGRPLDPPLVGVLPGPGLSPVHVRAPSTDVEIILVPIEMMFLANLVSRSIVMILNPRRSKGDEIQVPSPSSVDFDDPRSIRGIFWLEMILFYHVAHGQSLVVPLPPIGDRHEPLRSWVLDAIETFAIAHEYGHFIAGHAAERDDAYMPSPDVSSRHAKELEADIVGQALVFAVGRQTRNPMTALNAGGGILLHVGEFIRQVRSILSCGHTASGSVTHPSLKERMAALGHGRVEGWCEPAPEAIREYQERWNTFMEMVWIRMEPFFVDVFRQFGGIDSWQECEGAQGVRDRCGIGGEVKP